MTEQPDTGDGEFSAQELIEVIKNHGFSRRTAMKGLGVGSMLALGTGSVAATHDNPHPPHIDPH